MRAVPASPRSPCWRRIAAAPALAQSKGERLDMLESRMGAVERQLENQGLLEMSRQLEALDGRAAHSCAATSSSCSTTSNARARQQRDQYVDLDTRLRAAEAALTAAQATVAPRRARSGVPGGLQPAEGRQVRRGGHGAARFPGEESAARARAQRDVLARRGVLRAPRLSGGARGLRGPAEGLPGQRARRRMRS